MDPGISLDVVSAVKTALVARGMPEDAVPIRSDQPLVEGPLADELIDRGASLLGDPAIGLTIASAIPIGGLGLIDYTLCTSATVREAFEKTAAHFGIATQRLRLSVAHEGDRAVLLLDRVPGVPNNRHWNEFTFAMGAARLRQTISRDVAFIEVTFTHDAPLDASVHERYFGTPVTFGAPANRLVFAAEYLDHELLTASRSLASLLELRIREVSSALGAADPLVDKTRRTLAAMLDERRTEIDELAVRLGISKRTLQRALGELGTSHSELLDSVRRERARQLLDAGGRVADVSAALAFSAPSAFFRAYRRWTGTSPRGGEPDDQDDDKE